VNTKVDSRFSPNTKFTFSSMLNDTRENRRRNYETRAFTTQLVGTTGTAGILPGYTERTDTKSSGRVRARRPSSAADQLADPVGAAQRDYATNFRELDGGYTQSFPSAHLTHDITPQLQGAAQLVHQLWPAVDGEPAAE